MCALIYFSMTNEKLASLIVRGLSKQGRTVLTFSQDTDLSSTVFNVIHLQLTTTFETQDLCAFNLHIPQLYPLEVTPGEK